MAKPGLWQRVKKILKLKPGQVVDEAFEAGTVQPGSGDGPPSPKAKTPGKSRQLPMKKNKKDKDKNKEPNGDGDGKEEDGDDEDTIELSGKKDKITMYPTLTDRQPTANIPSPGK